MVLSDETLGSRTPGDPPPPPWYRNSVFWIIARRITFSFGMALLGGGIGGVLAGLQGSRVAGDADVLIGLGMALIGLCIPLGPLPWFMRESKTGESEK